MMRALLLALGVVCATGGPTIAVVGSVNVDITMQVQRLPHQHETLMASAPKVDLALGGKGANQAVAAARLGAAVRFVGRLGRDAHGDWLKKILKSNGVDIAGCSHSQELPSGQGMVMLDAEGGASSVVVGGANMDWASFSAPTLEETLRGASVLLLQQEIPEKINVAAAEVAKAQGVTVIQDVGGEDRPISAQLLPLIDFLCPNENELQRLTGMPVATREEALLAAKSLVSKGVSAVLVTLGERGAMVVTKAETLEVAPFAVPSVVDGTAAGDAFRAALAVAIGEKQSLQNGLRLASAAGALAVSRKGAEPSLPHRKDCEALLGGSSVEQVLAAQTVQSLQGSCEKSWAFASRLNSMKERLDLWNGSTDTLGLIERQGQVKGLGLVYLNFPQHLEGLQPQEMLKALDKAGLKAGGIALRFPEHMRLGALTNPSRELRQEAVELTKSACRWAESLGTEEVVVWPQTDGYDYQLQVDYLSAWSRAVEAFREVLDSSACRQKKVSLEFKPTDEISRFALVPSTGAALLFLRDVDRENFGPRGHVCCNGNG